jgi:hypothetical protein
MPREPPVANPLPASGPVARRRPGSQARIRAAPQALPGEQGPVTQPGPFRENPTAPARETSLREPTLRREGSPAGAAERALRQQVRELLEGLAARLEPALLRGLSQVARAWDQVDALQVIDHRLDDQLSRLRHEGQRALAGAGPSQAAAALEALWTAEAAVSLVTLVERRLATFVRLRLRAPGGADALQVDGRPFLDVAAALAEAARAWR